MKNNTERTKNVSTITGIIACVLWLLFAFITPLLAQDIMMVEDAIRIGLKNNYDIQIARNTAEADQNNRGKGIANFLPVIETSGNFRYDASNEKTGSPMSFGNSDSRTWSSQIDLRWTLFDGFRMFADKKRYDELADRGEYQARNIIENTVVAITRAFFNLVQHEQLLDVAISTRDVSKTRLAREKVRRDVGGASSTDFLNASVNLNNDQSLLLDHELIVIIAKKDLNVLLAIDPLTPVAIKKEIIVPPIHMNLNELMGLVRQQNSTLLTARKNRSVALENVRIARSVFWPRLTLNGAYGYTDRALVGNDILANADKNRSTIDAAVGLVLTFNLFNGNIDRINIQNARLEALNQSLELKNKENEIAGMVKEKYSTFQKRCEIVQLEEQNVVTAQQNMELEKQRYATGASDSLDFRDAQVKLVRAEATLITARFQARIALLDIQQLTGKLEIE